MKRIVIMMVMALSMTVAMAQSSTRRTQLSVASYVATLAESYFNQLSLSSSQQKKVKNLNKTYAKKNRSQYQTKYDSSLKSVLSDTQYTKYQAIRKGNRPANAPTSSTKKSRNSKKTKTTKQSQPRPEEQSAPDERMHNDR